MRQMRLILIAIASVFSVIMGTAGRSYAQSDANIVGHVLDIKSKEHIPYISITVKGTTITTLTDANGHYFLSNLPVGKITLLLSAIGYKSVEMDVQTKEGITLEQNFEIEEDLVSLQSVVVSANRSKTHRNEAPALINVLDSKLFEYTNATTLSQGLSFQPGVRIENNCQNCGFQQVRINGLDGPYTQILIDSRPVFSSLAGVYGLEQIPANMIQQVEVLRGGGSALYGSSAIAGTINIITKEPIRNTAQFAHTITSIGNSSSFDNNTTLNASLVSDNKKAGLYIFGQNRYRKGYDHDEDGYTELPKIHSQTIGMRSFLKTGLHSKISLEYHHLQEFRRGGDSLDVEPHRANIAEEIKHSIDCAGANFEYSSPSGRDRFNIYGSMQNIKRDSYYGSQQNEDAYGKTSDLTIVAGGQYVHTFNKCLFMPADLTAGFEYTRDNLKDRMLGYNRETHQIINTESLFVQNEWKNKKFSFLLGGRFDKHNLLENLIFSPRANIRYNPTENISLRLSYSSGFRAPQAFDEDLHIANVGGTVSMIRLGEDLKEERSHSLSFSADMYRNFGLLQTNLLVEGFYSLLKDAFALKDMGLNEDGVLIYERCNEKGAKVAGITIEAKIAYLSYIQLQGGVTLQQSRYDEPYQWSESAAPVKKMFRSPNTYGYFTATSIPVKNLSVALSGTYTGKMVVEHKAGYIKEDIAATTKDFFDMGLKVSYKFNIYNTLELQVDAGLHNILNSYQDDFDKGIERDSGYIYGPSLPRSWFAGIKVNF